jgi:hypothetical protein
MDECFNHLYGNYIRYHTFEWVEFIYVLGGGVIFTTLMTIVLKKNAAYLLFLILFAGVVLIRWKVYLYCH